MAHLVTGHAGTQHIMPSDDGAFNAGVLGTGKYVLDLGNKFAHEIVSNNLVKVSDGELVNQGRHMNIPVNNYEEVTIENGLQGVKRYDLICMRYTKNADTGIESAEMVVVKGTSSTSPSDPTCEEGNILEGALVDDFPLYRVRLDGLNIEGVDCLFEAIPSLEVVNAKADANAEAIEANTEAIQGIKAKDCPYTVLNSDYGVGYIVKNGIVHLMATKYGVSVDGTVSIGTLPQGIRPRQAIRARNYTGDSPFLEITASGNVQLMTTAVAGAFSGNILLDKTFIAN